MEGFAPVGDLGQGPLEQECSSRHQDELRHVGGGFAPYKQDVHLIGDPRSMRLIEAAYGSL